MIPFSWLVILGLVAVAALLLLAIVLALTGPPSPRDHDGPWGMGAVLLLGLSMAPSSPAEQPMRAGCGGPWAATIALHGAELECSYPGAFGGAPPVTSNKEQ